MLSKSKFFCLGILAVAYYYKITFSQPVEDGPIVSTIQGKIQGTAMYSRNGRKFFGFLGVPYGKPPVSELRFEPPEPADSWEGIRDGREYGAQCLQFDNFMGVVKGEEDCLFINIFSPILPNENVRLGALGFLNTGDGQIRGNQGLKDQSLALKWVGDNIGFFGGDNNKVTLLGESAGAVCSHLHLFSPMSRGYFSSVVSSSGSGHHFWAINQTPGLQAKRFAQKVGCKRNNTIEMKACLKKINGYEMVQAHSEMLDPLRDPLAIFKPSIEVAIADGNTFLAENPRDMTLRGDFAKVPWVTGVNSEEGLIISASMLGNKTIQNVAQEDWVFFVDRSIWLKTNVETAEKVRRFYFGNGTCSLSNNCSAHSMNPLITPITDMVSDYGFYYDTNLGASLQSRHAPVYLYYYSYRGEWSIVNFFPEIYNIFSRRIEVTFSLVATWLSKNVFGNDMPNYGAAHSDELSLLFYMPWISEIDEESRDYDMSLDLVKLWTDFAHNSEQLKFKSVEWPVINVSSQPLQYMNIDRNPTVIEEPFAHRLEFWRSLIG